MRHNWDIFPANTMAYDTFSNWEDDASTWGAGIAVQKLSDMKSLDHSFSETNVVQSVRSKLVSEFKLHHANIIGVDEAQTRWCDVAVVIMRIGHGLSMDKITGWIFLV